jgi:hypothetical protein
VIQKRTPVDAREYPKVVDHRQRMVGLFEGRYFLNPRFSENINRSAFNEKLLAA